jgi:hypothetical protein
MNSAKLQDIKSIYNISIISIIQLQSSEIEIPKAIHLQYLEIKPKK